MTTPTETNFKYITFKNLFNIDLPPIEYLVKDVIIKKGLIYVYGPPASFKTNFLLYTALLGHEGQNVFNFEVKEPFRTLWIDEENGKIGMKDKLTKISKGIGIDVNKLEDNVFFIFNNFKILADWLYQLEVAIKQFKPNMIVIDSIAKVFTGDERHEKDVAEIFSRLKPIIEKYGIAIVLIHHSRKLDKKYGAGGLDDMSGSREFGASADITIYLQQFGKNRYLLKQTKSRYGGQVDSINFEVTGDDDSIKLQYIGTKQENLEKAVDLIKPDIWAWLIENPNDTYKTKEIVDAMKTKGHKDTNIRNAIEQLRKEKILGPIKFGVYKFMAKKNGILMGGKNGSL